MVSILEEVINDFEEEISALKQFSALRYTLKKILRSLKILDDVVIDGYDIDPEFKSELLKILKDSENEIGALLRTDRRQKLKSEQHERMTILLVKISGHKNAILSKKATTEGSFRIPLFTRSDSFKSVDYDAPDSEEASEVHCISVEIEKKSIRASLEMRNGRRQRPDLGRHSAPPRPPPPSKNRSNKKKSDIARLPKVVKFFHSFRSWSTEPIDLKPTSKDSESVKKGDPSSVIAELMSKSKHAQKIAQEVEMHEETVKNWAKEIHSVKFVSMDDLVRFVETMDKDLDTTLTDETSILKRIGNWPKRYDIMREAVSQWKQLATLESSLLDWKWDTSKFPDRELERIRNFLDLVDEKLHSMMRHQGLMGSYQEAGIPWSDAVFERVKAAALVPIEIYLKAVLEASKKTTSEEKRRGLFKNVANFAFKGHQLVGGFNSACTQAFAAMESAAMSTIDRPTDSHL